MMFLAAVTPLPEVASLETAHANLRISALAVVHESESMVVKHGWDDENRESSGLQ